MIGLFMVLHSHSASVDELLDQAGDAVARNDWRIAKELAEEVLQQTRHPEAELVLRTANAYLETERGQDDPLSSSRDFRFMSIMFCDVVGSTRLARELGDARWRNTLERFRRRCGRAVRRYDGYIHAASGDELLILFGYPRVREDDARRAVLAGLDIVTAIQSLSALLEREHGMVFRVRVGVHTGRALIRTDKLDITLSAGVEIGDGLVGDAVNVAKRIETAANPNTVWVSDTTRRIVEGFFDFATSPGDVRQAESVPRANIAAYQVNGRTSALNRHQIARVRSDEMVGRRSERDHLLQLWQTAKREGAPFIVVSGAAGIGKSRLIEFLSETAAGSSRLECVCTEMLQSVAFGALIGVLERFANIRQADSSETRLSKLRSAFRQIAAAFDEFIPYLAWMMSIPTPGSREIEELEPEVVRRRIFDILLNVLTLAASIRPSVFWFEDLQWADHSTLEFCRHLEARGPIPGLMVVATVRTDHERAASRLPWSDEEIAGGRVVAIELGPLSPEESRQLIATRAGWLRSETFFREILESTGGNPLYIEEVVRSVVAGADSRQKADGAEQPAIAIPESLQPIFAQIVDRLGGDRNVAQMASLMGRDLPEPLTRTVIASILGLSEEDVLSSLVRLIDAEIIEPLLTERTPGYRFHHELIREALVLSVGPDAKENHGRIANVIEQSSADASPGRLALLAYHLERAEQYERAAAYRLTAGLNLQARGAHREAIGSFDQGLESLSGVAHTAHSTSVARLELALRASRGVSVQTTKGYTDKRAGEDWARAYDLSKRIGAEGALVPALGGLWSFYFVRGAHTFVNELHATSVTVARQIIDAAGDDPEAQLIGYVCLGYSEYYRGDLTAGRASAERSWALHEKVKDRPSHLHVPQDPGLAALNFLGPVRWSLGDQVGGLRASEESRAAAAALESKRALNLSRIGQTNAWLHQIRHDHQQAFQAAEQALLIAREFHIEWAVVNLSIHRGLAIANSNADRTTVQDAIATVNENLGYWRAAGAESFVPYFLGKLAEAYHNVGDNMAALDLLSEAIELADRIGEHCHDAELYRVRGQARLAGADRSKGVGDLVRAIATAREQCALSFEIRSTVTLLSIVPELTDREMRIGQLETAIASLSSSENGRDEGEARRLIARERRS
jgi:class 3 adenylate cyclase/tetratricopeptide (TPR) repeat protein